MQRGEKDFAKKASVNAEKSFFNDFLGFSEKKKSFCVKILSRVSNVCNLYRLLTKRKNVINLY